MKKGLTLCLATVLILTAGCGAKPDEAVKQETKSKVVEVYKIPTQTPNVILSATGIVSPKEDVSLSFGTSGKIVQMKAQNGVFVGKGEVLATLDTTYAQKELEAASGQIDEAYAKRTKTLKGATQEAIEQERLQLKSAQQRLDKARSDVAQSQQLFEGGAISQNELTNKKRDLQQEEISFRNQQISLEELLKGAKPEDIAVADASIKSASGQIAQAKKSLQDTKLIAPFAGTIVQVNQQVGEMASPGHDVIHLVDLSEVKVAIDVTNDVIGQYREGETVNVSNTSGLKSTGKIKFVSPVVDEKTGKYHVEITVPNQDRSWRGGMLAAVEKPRKVNGLIVPLESVGINQSKRFVMIVKNGIVKKQEVQVGQIIGEQMEIMSGVQSGDQLIRSGITYYADGEKVVPKGE
ncbi:efflux RND transporter periplasmic adaptor subunit [Brevibacillus ginsengisoli]|uniref:efflux RND transporter periplasmic adaptor subunit n=1 Tax=Brevibacillus ginsengisoli TaxID=363854 RepID=UPI003CF208A1